MFGLLALAQVLWLGVGCYSTQEGGLKAGLPFASDSIVSRYELPRQRVYEAAKGVLTKNGVLTNDDQVTHVLKGVVDARTVWIKLEESGPGITQVTIQARTKGGGPDVGLASDLDKGLYGLLITR
jgi:hypothetical protein